MWLAHAPFAARSSVRFVLLSSTQAFPFPGRFGDEGDGGAAPPRIPAAGYGVPEPGARAVRPRDLHRLCARVPHRADGREDAPAALWRNAGCVGGHARLLPGV